MPTAILARIIAITHPVLLPFLPMASYFNLLLHSITGAAYWHSSK